MIVCGGRRRSDEGRVGTRALAQTGAFLVALAALLAVGAQARAYSNGGQVPMFVNKVGPYFNTHETYHYYSLPVCTPQKIVSRSLTLGEVLAGDRMAAALYQINFKQNKPKTDLCTLELTVKDLAEYHKAVDDLFYFEFIIDDLPVRGFLGQLEEHVIDLPNTYNIYLFTHMHFTLQYNGDHIVAADVIEGEEKMELPHPALLATEAEGNNETISVQFSYSVEWTENTAISYAHRNRNGKTFFPVTLEVHWLSIINGIVLALLLVGFVAMLLTRALNKDFARYSQVDDMELSEEADIGWKLLHSDVFRFPEHKSIFAAMLGNGIQFLLVVSFILILALLGVFNARRHHSMTTTGVLLWVSTSFVSGFYSNKLFVQMNGQRWAWNIVLTSSIFTGPFFLMWSIINSVAWYEGSTQALPATTVILLILIWLLVGFPLTVIGGIIGKNRAGYFDSPCRTKNVARDIRPQPWYKGPLVQFAVGGFIPFSAISVELYYIFATVWGREIYTLYGILLVVFIVLLAVTGSVSIALTYFQLSNEDHRWWWRSFISSGFTGVFVFLYAVFYFHERSNMSGHVQTVQFFGYTLACCYIVFMALGAVGFLFSLRFVRYIYKNVKLD